MSPGTDAPARPRRYGYLGPEGTFTDAALGDVLVRRGEDDAERVPAASVDAALAAVRAGDLDAAMVPMENSVEGGVAATLDGLAGGDPLVVVAEALVPVTFVLGARPGTRLEDVAVVSTHTHAHAQCRGWLAEHLPRAQYVPSSSTAAAAAGLAPGAAATGYDAALCAGVAAERYGLEVLARDVGDTAGAVTRFVLVGRPTAPPPPTGADRTTVIAFQPQDHPGMLLELLEQFASRGVNLTRIESRPTGDALGRYCFAIDAEGHVQDARVAEALLGLHRFCAQVRFLGSYPRADGRPVTVRPGTDEAAFGDARAWLDAVREGRRPPA
ncbi:prephenate dehydratase [Pseudokineococcus basanitobsidens]|uniref:Prephenate dehydratase n=1 Tax=Pseudokineococcus basanitobsidens TaxID=1926649 RepID=A0ABU8RFW7_9ACTN